MCFDPRPREGATVYVDDPGLAQIVSIHAPVKGRPEVVGQQLEQYLVSIHAPVKGRLARARASVASDRFRSTPP